MSGMAIERSARWHWVMDLVVLAGIWGLLLAYFRPELLLAHTTTAGGDTGSHYYTAHYLLNHLLDNGRIMGWVPGNLAGYPLFQLYFPLPFAAMAGLSYLTGLQVAFKLVTAAGAFLIPLGAWAGLRLARTAFPIPALGAVFTLPFLFNETQAMWGGNLPSLLAGEFCYSLGLALLMVWMGSMHHDMDQRGHPVRNAIILAAVGLCHGCTLLFGVLAGGLWLVHRDLAKRGAYLFKVYALAFCLMGFWIVPLLLTSEYNTMHNMVWHIDTWRKVLPPVLMPIMAVCLIDLGMALWRRDAQPGSRSSAIYFASLVALALLLYMVAFKVNVIDIRFFPFAWLACCLWAATAIGRWCKQLAARNLVPIFFLLITALGVSWQSDYISNWINWNYTGFESRAAWGDFERLNKWLAGGVSDPRVLHEHDEVHNRVGTSRAFENLPLWSGRNTMEGLYIQSSLASPFIFYLQSQTSQQSSRPLPGYNYSRFDLDRAIERMALFNVGQYVVVNDKTRQAAMANEQLKLAKQIGPYSVFTVTTNPGVYVEPLKFKPVLVITKRWKELSYEWFRRGDLAVPLVFKQSVAEGDVFRFVAIWNDRLGIAKRVPLTKAAPLKQSVQAERIEVETPTRAPFLVKMSYHPNWQVRGADAVYLASPCFLLVYPNDQKVVITYGRSLADYLGLGLSALAVLGLLLSLPGVRGLRTARALRGVATVPLDWAAGLIERLLARPITLVARRPQTVAVIAGLLVGGLLCAYVLTGGKVDASVAYNQAMAVYQKQDYANAARLFKRALVRWPRSPVVDNTALHWGLSLYNAKQWSGAKKAFSHLVNEYPESNKAAEAVYHIGLCESALNNTANAITAYKRVIDSFADSPWAAQAKARLAELSR